MDIRDRRRIRDELLHRAEQSILLMGILNVTPDSFSDGGQFQNNTLALEHAKRIVEEGGEIIDVGGESTRPGAEPVDEVEERRRTIDLVSQLTTSALGPISIDTYKSAIAREAADAGAVLVNDISGMTKDPEMANAVASSESAVVVTYNRGDASESIEIADDMNAFFQRAFLIAEKNGIPREHIWLDPGVGFAKTLEQNVEVLNRLDVVLDFGRPVLVGLSRKSLIGLTLDRVLDDRLPGTLGAHLASLEAGARILRVHDVQEHADAIKMHALVRGITHG
ncbi:MAG: dihydropteroate synthase [Pseudomonadota bacterium]